jgi:hypothetical protein
MPSMIVVVIGTKTIMIDDEMIDRSLNLRHKTKEPRQEHKRLKLETQNVQEQSINNFLLQCNKKV